MLLQRVLTRPHSPSLSRVPYVAGDQEAQIPGPTLGVPFWGGAGGQHNCCNAYPNLNPNFNHRCDHYHRPVVLGTPSAYYHRLTSELVRASAYLPSGGSVLRVGCFFGCFFWLSMVPCVRQHQNHNNTPSLARGHMHRDAPGPLFPTGPWMPHGTSQ